MEFIIISLLEIIVLIILKYLYGYNIKEIKQLAENKELDELGKKYPDNISICKEYLRKLKNESVKVEENKDSKTSLYIAITNKISIANIDSSYTRIQTIAHECLHSIQDKKLLLANFIFSNIFILYFFIICILEILKVLPYNMMFLNILVILGLACYSIKLYLESDAMIKARYLAEDYMKEKEFSSYEETKKILKGFDHINEIGVKCVTYNLLLGIMIKILIFSLICIFR